MFPCSVLQFTPAMLKIRLVLELGTSPRLHAMEKLRITDGKMLPSSALGGAMHLFSRPIQPPLHLSIHGIGYYAIT